MYSARWFDTFVASIPRASIETEVAAIASLLPLPQFRTVLDVGCGTGRTIAPLVAHGYDMVGIDVNARALRMARDVAPAATFVALDQRNVAALRTQFDAALILWNSLGFNSMADDEATLRGLHSVIRPGGHLLLDLYNPAWLADHELDHTTDARGATVTRRLQDGRARHRITYADGAVDHIDFNVYTPDEMRDILISAGFAVDPPMVWWRTATVTQQDARYQLGATR